MQLKILPNSLWLAYSIVNPKDIQSMLPCHMQLGRIPLLQDDKFPEPKLLFNAYDISSKWMNGQRIDIQTVAINKKTQKAHLVILDVVTNTLQWNPSSGITSANAYFAKPKCKENDFTLKVRSSNRKNFLNVKAKRHKKSRIAWKFAVQANEECFYRDFSEPFEMTFDDKNIMTPVRLLDITEAENSYWKDFRSTNPTHAFIHEQTMIFDVDVNF